MVTVTYTLNEKCSKIHHMRYGYGSVVEKDLKYGSNGKGVEFIMANPHKHMSS